MMQNRIHKVTAFITRETVNGRQLLLFKHPIAGIQLPAGTVDEGEWVETAVLREVAEETGLQQVRIIRKVGIIENELAANELILTQDLQILFKPHADALPFRRMLTRGVTVQHEGEEGDFTKISYLEHDRLPNPTAITFQMIGFVPHEAVSSQKTRHFFHLDCWEEGACPREGVGAVSWTLQSDHGYTYAPFWTSLIPKPTLVTGQNRWLDFVYDKLIV